MSRKPTARNSAGKSQQNERTAAALAAPGLTVATRKIAARVKAETTACGSGINSVCAVNGSDSVGGTPINTGLCAIAY
jgi:hypothetical protein